MCHFIFLNYSSSRKVSSDGLYQFLLGRMHGKKVRIEFNTKPRPNNKLYKISFF